MEYLPLIITAVVIGLLVFLLMKFGNVEPPARSDPAPADSYDAVGPEWSPGETGRDFSKVVISPQALLLYLILMNIATFVLVLLIYLEIR